MLGPEMTTYVMDPPRSAGQTNSQASAATTAVAPYLAALLIGARLRFGGGQR